MAGYRYSKSARSRGKKLDAYAMKMARRRYMYKGTYIPKIGQIAKDVAFLKSGMNTEKKYFSQAVAPTTFALSRWVDGQPDFIRRGDQVCALQCPPKGGAFDERIGNSIKLTSIEMKIDLKPANASAFKTDTKYHIFVLQYVGEPAYNVNGGVDSTRPTTDTPRSDSEIATKFFDVNLTTNAGLIDGKNFREREFYKNFRILKVINGTLRAPNQFEDGTEAVPVQIHQPKRHFWVKPSSKLAHWKMEDSATANQTPLINNIYLLYTAEQGIQAEDLDESTAIIANCQYRINYVDN